MIYVVLIEKVLILKIEKCVNYLILKHWTLKRFFVCKQMIALEC